MNLLFDHTQSRDEVERTMTDYVNMNAIPLKMSVPTVFHCYESDEARGLMFRAYHPGKVGETIHKVLESFWEEKNWKAGVYFDHPSGFTHVFLVKDQQTTEFPTWNRYLKKFS